MNNHYAIIIIGWIIGQFGYAACSVYVLQRNKNVNYWKAFSIYLASEIGSFVMAFAALLAILFIANDFIDMQITRKDLMNKEMLTLKEKIIVYQRTASFIFGGLCQHLIYVAFKKGKKKIEQYEVENKIEDSK